MKNLNFLFTLLSCLLVKIAVAQQPTQIHTVRYNVDESSTVRDSSGKVYPYKVWAKMMRAGNYTLIPEHRQAGETTFILTKKTKRQENVIKNQADAQADIPQPAPNQVAQAPVKFVPPDEQSIVKDSSGMVFPYVVWHKMITSGDYMLRYKSTRSEPIGYFLIKKTQQEKEAFMANLPKPTESDRFKTGATFSPFKEKDMNGEKLDLKKMTDKVIVLNFWFIGCPPCRAEIPDLNAIADHYKTNNDVVFIAVCLDEAYDIKQYLKINPFNYHIIDNGRYIADKYGVHLYPTNVVIDKEGKIAYSSVSNQTANPYWIQKTIDAALAAPLKTTAAQ